MTSSPPPSAPDSRLRALIDRAQLADGHPPFSDASLAELALGVRRELWLGSAVALVSESEAEFVVDPDARRQGHGRAILNQLLVTARGDLLLWAHGGHPAAQRLAASHGLEPVRELLLLRAAVPAPPLAPPSTPPAAPRSAAPPAVPLAPPSAAPASRAPVEFAGLANAADLTWATLANSSDFERTIAELLELNARAFAEHPEQGQLTRTEFTTLCAEPWFDARDLLLVRAHRGELLGFCWLKVTAGTGEFYVVGVDPAHQGLGLGRRLMTAGFALLADRGVREAHLYVESDNAAALRLYREMGFRVQARDIQYRWHSEPDD